MGCCWRPRRLTTRLIAVPIVLVICIALKTSVYSLLTVSLDVNISQRTVTVGNEDSLKTNKGPTTRDHISQSPMRETPRHPGALVSITNRPLVMVHPQPAQSPHAARPVNLPDVIGNVTRSPGKIKPALHQAVNGSQQKILILAYYRSGSTLTGSFFNRQPGTFYTFEPLHAVFKNADRRRNLVYFNGRVRQAPRWEDLNDISMEILQSFYSCDLEGIDWHTITSGFGSKSAAYAQFVRCVKSSHLGGAYMQTVKQNCLSGLIQRCKSSKSIVVKTIRMRMALAEELLKVIPDLKIVHLLRDPRGMACSLQRKQCQGSLTGARGMCERLTSDVLRRRTLVQTHPDSVFSLTYEALVKSPLRTVMKMFQFVGLDLHSDVAKWISDNLFSGHEDNRPLSTTKSNSIATAYNWTRRIHWNVVDRYQQACADVLVTEQYPIFYNLYDVRNFKMPVVNTKEQLLEIGQLLSANDVHFGNLTV